jgi:2-oxo-4-hydroxy-4-carboxy-5-ureidoimidazoline decarboxylase
MNLQLLNAQSKEEAYTTLLQCCGARRWAEHMATQRPFASEEELYAAARRVWQGLAREDWLEAFAAHPRIGDRRVWREKFDGAWSAGEQAGVAAAPEDTLVTLEEKNRQYEGRFGHIFLVSAAGKSAQEVLALLEQRLSNNPAEEILIAANEQQKITRLRLEKAYP